MLEAPLSILSVCDGSLLGYEVTNRPEFELVSTLRSKPAKSFVRRDLERLVPTLGL